MPFFEKYQRLVGNNGNGPSIDVSSANAGARAYLAPNGTTSAGGEGGAASLATPLSPMLLSPGTPRSPWMSQRQQHQSYSHATTAHDATDHSRAFPASSSSASSSSSAAATANKWPPPPPSPSSARFYRDEPQGYESQPQASTTYDDDEEELGSVYGGIGGYDDEDSTQQQQPQHSRQYLGAIKASNTSSTCASSASASPPETPQSELAAFDYMLRPTGSYGPKGSSHTANSSASLSARTRTRAGSTATSGAEDTPASSVRSTSPSPRSIKAPNMYKQQPGRTYSPPTTMVSPVPAAEIRPLRLGDSMKHSRSEPEQLASAAASRGTPSDSYQHDRRFQRHLDVNERSQPPNSPRLGTTAGAATAAALAADEASRVRKDSAPRKPDARLDDCLENLRLFAQDDEPRGGMSRHDERSRSRSPKSPSGLTHSSSSPADLDASASARSCGDCGRYLTSADRLGPGNRRQDKPLCASCYTERLPRCRACARPIEGRAVSSSDGKVAGKYHQACFACATCAAPFPDGEFYVYEQRPYCQRHYHALNGSLCANAHCDDPIEGPCVSLVGEDRGNGGRCECSRHAPASFAVPLMLHLADHLEHFVCSHPRGCATSLLEFHFVVDSKPYCERHANSLLNPPAVTSTRPANRPAQQQHGGYAPASGATTRAKKRITIIENSRR